MHTGKVCGMTTTVQYSKNTFQKFGFDALGEDGEWKFLYNLQRMSLKDAYNWACAMKGVLDAEFVAIRLVRLGDD